MKRIMIALAALTLVAGGACAKSTKIGAGIKGGSSKISSPSPTPKEPKPTVKKTKAKVKTVAVDPGYKGRTYQITITDSANGYTPRDKRLFVGDTIVFTNLDATSEHSFTADSGAWDSGKLKKGEKFTFKVNLTPAKYTFHCEVVPYVVGGPIDVLPAPK